MYSKSNALLVLYITSLALVESQASVWDGIPFVSQFKSAVQAISGDTEGAKRTQENFLNQAPVFSQAKSAVQAISGDLDGARKTQELFAKNHLEPIVDSTPVIGHIKGGIHMAVGDKKRGEEILKGASRSTAVLVGGAVGGPAGAVLAGVAADGTISGIDSVIHNEKKLYGTFDTVDKINHLDAGEAVDFGLGIAGDAIVGTGGKGAAGKAKGGNNRIFSTNTGRHSTDSLTSLISNHPSKPVKPNIRGNAVNRIPAIIDRFADPEMPEEEDGFHGDEDDSNHISESEQWDDSDVDEESEDEDDDSDINNESEEWDDSDLDEEYNSDVDEDDNSDVDEEGDSDIYEESEDGVLRDNGRFGSTNEQPQYDFSDGPPISELTLEELRDRTDLPSEYKARLTRRDFAEVNDVNSKINCWFCSMAAALDTTVYELDLNVDQMEDQTNVMSSMENIQSMYSSYLSNVETPLFEGNFQDLQNYFKTALQDGEQSNFIFLYESEGTGHVVHGRVWNDGNGVSKLFVDFQQPPFRGRFTTSIPAAERYTVIHADEVNPNEVGPNNENGPDDGANDEDEDDENGPYDEDGANDEDGPYDEDGSYDENGQHDENGQYDDNGPYKEDGSYAEDGANDEDGPYDENELTLEDLENYENRPNDENDPYQEDGSYAEDGVNDEDGPYYENELTLEDLENYKNRWDGEDDADYWSNDEEDGQYDDLTLQDLRNYENRANEEDIEDDNKDMSKSMED